MTRDRLEELLYNAIDMLLAEYSREDIIKNIEMTLDEYKQLIEVDE